MGLGLSAVLLLVATSALPDADVTWGELDVLSTQRARPPARRVPCLRLRTTHRMAGGPV